MLQRPFSFAITFLALFALTFAFLAMTDSLPDATTGTTPDTSVPTVIAPSTAVASSPEQPVRVVAKDINLDIVVANPATTSVTVLDDALLQGAVRYPTSALLGVDGTVLLFGHSSYLPIVYNQHYKTFNGIQNLKTGETVSVYSGSTEYRYEVTGVRIANAEQDTIELPASGKHLVLVTCDSFATKSTRYVVNADFVGAYSLN
jgi:LPXTG-site transpeptidase (sortase) family protein